MPAEDTWRATQTPRPSSGALREGARAAGLPVSPGGIKKPLGSGWGRGYTLHGGFLDLMLPDATFIICFTESASCFADPKKPQKALHPSMGYWSHGLIKFE